MTGKTKGWKTLALLVGLVAMTGAQAAKLDDVLKRGHLVVGTGSTNAPWHFQGADGKLQGFDIDISKVIAKGLSTIRKRSSSSSRARMRASPTCSPTRSTSAASSSP